MNRLKIFLGALAAWLLDPGPKWVVEEEPIYIIKGPSNKPAR